MLSLMLATAGRRLASRGLDRHFSASSRLARRKAVVAMVAGVQALRVLHGSLSLHGVPCMLL